MDQFNITVQKSNETKVDTFDIIAYTLLFIEAAWTFLANIVVMSAAVKFSITQKASCKFKLST